VLENNITLSSDGGMTFFQQQPTKKAGVLYGHFLNWCDVGAVQI
jgi:hypothetical protein